MKKIIALTLCASMAFSFAACGNDNNTSNQTQSSSSDSLQIPNPLKECKTLEEATKLAGFPLSVPESIDGYQNRVIEVNPDPENPMIQVLSQNSSSEILIRKAAGSNDISGDYNQYSETEVTSVDGVSVTVKGNEGKRNLATWTRGDYAFSVSVSDGISSNAMAQLVAAVQ